MGEFEEASGPGKTSPRLIQDLLDYDPRHPRADKRNLLTQPAPIFRDGAHYPLRNLPGDCTHRLFRIDGQSVVPQIGERPTTESLYKSVSFCERCLYHFEIIVDHTQRLDRKVPCELSSEFPLHHFQYLRSRFRQQEDIQKSPDKCDNYKEAHKFACSAPNCPVYVEIRISPPRLSNERLACILDQTTVFQRGRKTIEADPVRYAGAKPLQPLEILSVLRTYLVDAYNKSPSEVKKIAVRNKKFLLAFGDDCDELLKFLGFVPSQEIPANDDDQEQKPPEHFWLLPAVTPANEGKIHKTNRHFIEDVIWELSQRILDRPSEEKQAANSKPSYQALPAWRDFWKVLGCEDYPTSSRAVNLEQAEHPHYAGLGSVSNFQDKLIAFSYERQRKCDPPNRPYYLECLKGIAYGRDSADLQEEVVKAVSLGESTLGDIEEAYKFFAIDPNVHHGDEFILGIYESRIESAPRQKEEARECLLTIGKALNSSRIQEVANDKKMSVEEALEYLNVSSDTPSEYVEAMAIVMANDGDKTKAARALRAIANHRNELSLQMKATNIESGNMDAALPVNDAYRRLQITDSNTPDEMVFTYYQTLSANAPKGSKESYTEALQAIAQARNSNYLWTKLSNPNAVIEPSRGAPDQPVGLDNIGNTCYLNSLLQYYYTVRPVREVVMNFGEYRMPINAENLLKKRVGGRRVDRGEIVKAQNFVEELRHLFISLRTASTQSVKPTQDLAELTLFSSATEANYRRASISSPTGIPAIASATERPALGAELPPPPSPPDAPLPPIPSRPPPADGLESEDIEMVDRPKQDLMDMDDSSSDVTLVDNEQLHQRKSHSTSSKLENASPEYSIPDASAVEGTAQVELPEAIPEVDDKSNHIQSDIMTNGTMLTPPDEDVAVVESPPPVPPRMKPAPIQTSGESEDASRARAEKLFFGAQQDVTEVIGNVMFRLQCAIKPKSIDPKFGEQIDTIRETFYGANAVYLKKSHGYDVKVEDWANIIVFPASDGPRDIYEALDVVFDEQEVEFGNKENTTQYASINKLPPVVQIQIQRTAFNRDTQQASKNQNRLVFEETIYLDRYMDAEKVLQRRKEAWKWKDRLRRLELRRKILQDGRSGLPVAEALNASKEFLRSLQEEEVEDITVDGKLCEALEDRAFEIGQEMDSITEEITSLKKKLQDQFTDMREHRYRLQAVFMHRGTNSYGHYWIYIYDFPNDVWREYNDERVSIVQDRKRIFEQESPNSATPYYLVYVRDQDKDDLVDAVYRDMEELPTSTEKAVVELEDTPVNMDYSTVAGNVGQPENEVEVPRSWNSEAPQGDKRVHW